MKLHQISQRISKIKKQIPASEEGWLLAECQFFAAIYQHPAIIRSNPTVWKKEKQQFELNPKFKLNHFLTLMALVAIGGVGAHLYGLCGVLLSRNEDGYKAALTAIKYTFPSTNNAVVITVWLMEYFFGYDGVTFLNEILKTESLCRRYAQPSQKTENSPKIFLGQVLILLTVLSVVIPPVFAVFLYGFEENGSVYHQILHGVFGVKELGDATNAALSGIYLLITLYIAHLMGRAFAVAFGPVVIGLTLFFRSIGYLRMVRRWDPKVLSLYRQLLTIVQLIALCQSLLASVLMFFGLVLCVSSNYATIKMYDVLERQLYLIFPVVSGVVPMMVRMTLPLAVNCHEDTKELLGDWRQRVASAGGMNGHKRKLLLKELRATRPVKLYAGVGFFNLFPLEKSTEINYYKSITDYTINVILA